MDKPFLYKYKPLLLTDFELDENIKDLLRSFIDMDILNILFIGNSGSGKTSLINMLINEYYGSTNIYSNDNILYINNLKEQGISYYRNDVKTFCQTPSSIIGKKKLLIVDDIDFINEQSQQVFRNYIDKYSNNVNFLSSCVNSQKLIDSLQSRLIIIKTPELNKDKLINIINNICKKEEIYIDHDVIDFILTISNRSIRVIINYLEKFKLLNRKITIDIANKLCTNISFYEFEQFTYLCKIEKNLLAAIDSLHVLIGRGYSVMDILDNYFVFLKVTNNITEDEKYRIIPYICKYITVFNNIHEDQIELSHFTNNLILIFSDKDYISNI
jgi:DNA polymerase III delta prime subunit